MKRVTRENSSKLYIFLPYLSLNMGEDVPHIRIEGTQSGVPPRWCHVPHLRGPACSSNIYCRLPIDQIFKWPFLFYFFFGGGDFRLKTLCNFVSLLLCELWEWASETQIRSGPLKLRLLLFGGLRLHSGQHRAVVFSNKRLQNAAVASAIHWYHFYQANIPPLLSLNNYVVDWWRLLNRF